MDDNEARVQARKAAGPFLTEVRDTPGVAFTRFKRWHHRVQLAYAEILSKERPPKA